MTNQLVIHFPNSSFTIDTDIAENLTALSDYCKKEFGAYHSTDSVAELTIDKLSEKSSNIFNSKLFELGLI